MNRKQQAVHGPRMSDRRRDTWSKGRRGLSPWFWGGVLVVATILAVAVFYYLSLARLGG